MKYIVWLLSIFAFPAIAEPLAGSYAEAYLRSEEPDDLSLQEEMALLQSMTVNLGLSVKACGISDLGKPPKSFNMVFVLGREGEILKVYRDTYTDVGDCLEAELMKQSFGSQRKYPLYVSVPITFSDE